MKRAAINSTTRDPGEDFDSFVEPPPFDLLKVPLLGRLLLWRHSRTLVQVPLLLVSIAMILHGLLGPTISPKNLATVLTWVHFRGALVLVLLCAGNFFCLVDGLDHCWLLRGHTGHRWRLQTRDLLQVHLPHWPVQFSGLDSLPSG